MASKENAEQDKTSFPSENIVVQEGSFTHPPSITLGIPKFSKVRNQIIARSGVKIVIGILILSITLKKSSLAEIIKNPNKKYSK